MSKTFFDVAISLDGFLAGNNRSPKNTLGDGGMTLHNWMFVQKAFWEHLGKEEGKEDGPDGNRIRETIARTGACIMGKRMFEEGEPNWPEDLFKSDVYVLTHEKRNPWIQKGTTTFHFVNEGIDNTLERAKQSANGKDVRIMGGAGTIQQFLNAGLVDEFIIHITPAILGSGLRLFDNLNKSKFDFEIAEVIHAPLTTHLYYRVTNR